MTKIPNMSFFKSSMKHDYSGVDNLLFYQKNCSLIFCHANCVIEQMVTELKVSA